MGQVTLTNDSRKDDESQTWSAFQSSARRIGSSGQKSFDYLDGITWITACYQDLTLALLLVEIIFIYCITTKTSVWLEIKSSCWIAKIISSMFSSLSFLFLSSSSDGSLATKQIVFLQRPVLGRKRRESKVHGHTFLFVIHGCEVSLLARYPKAASPFATSTTTAVYVLSRQTHTQRRTNVRKLFSI